MPPMCNKARAICNMHAYFCFQTLYLLACTVYSREICHKSLPVHEYHHKQLQVLTLVEHLILLEGNRRPYHIISERQIPII